MYYQSICVLLMALLWLLLSLFAAPHPNPTRTSAVKTITRRSTQIDRPMAAY